MATQTVTLVGNETFTGNPFDDNYIITGGDGNSTVTLGAGADQLTLGAGNNVLSLGGGADRITAGVGDNTITTTGAGQNFVSLGDGNNTVTVGDGPDVITIGNGNNGVTAGNGNDALTLGNGVDRVTTGNGNSVISVGNGPGDSITVGTGANNIRLGNGAMTVVHTGAGNNTVSVSAQAVAADTIMGALTSSDGTGNTLLLTTAGAASAAGVSGFQRYDLADGQPSSLVLTSTNFSRLPGAITVVAGNAGATLDASALAAADAIVFQGGPGQDSASLSYAKTAANLTLDPNGSMTVAHGTAIADGFANVEQLSFADGGVFSTAGDVAGFASVTVAAAYTQVAGAIGNEVVSFAVPNLTLAVHGIVGTGSVQGFAVGDAIDLLGITGATLSTNGAGTTLTSAGATLNLGAAPSGSTFALVGDAKGGTQVVLDTPPSGNISFSDVTAGTNGVSTSAAYTGPLDYLQSQYISAGSDSQALRANTPNVFLKGGSGNDALQVTGGNNVLDGGGGSNFLVGGTGADGGVDTFFVEGRTGVNTWSTVLNFHEGDSATLWGFHPGLSTMPFTASDGAAGYTGLTLHSEINGPGTGVNTSLTFAGISQATADAHFSITSGTLGAGTAGATDYLLVQYNR